MEDMHRIIHSSYIALWLIKLNTNLVSFMIYMLSLILAEVSIVIDDCEFSIKAAVSQNLPVPMHLGRDVPNLHNLLGVEPRESMVPEGKVVVVTTRSQQQKQEMEEHAQIQAEMDSGATSKGLEEHKVPWEDWDEDLFQEPRSQGAKEPRSQGAKKARESKMTRKVRRQHNRERVQVNN